MLSRFYLLLGVGSLACVAWFVVRSQQSSVHGAAPAAVYAAASAPESASPELFDESRPPEIERAAYIPGAADEYELDSYWQSCQMVPLNEFEAVLAELEARLQFFEQVQFSNSHVLPMPQSDGSWTQRDFVAYYSHFAVKESRFLVEQCKSGALRRSPYSIVPPSVLDSSHPSAQLVPHFSPSLQAAYVARLEIASAPELFADRPMIYEIAKEVLGRDGQPEAEQLSARKAQEAATAR
jgi:hypothetical protein